MNSTRWTVAALVALAVALPLQAGELGDKAKPLAIKEWIKGLPVDVTSADGKSVYVVEFWATWCPPCLTSIPHLSELQNKYNGKHVTFVGISMDDQRTLGDVRPFVKKMGDKMNYTVAIDKDGATAKAYMGAFGVRGIPHAFIVDQKGRIIWHDHPMSEEFEKTIEQVHAGEFDLATAKKLMAKREQEARELDRLREQLKEYFRLVQSTGKDNQAAELGEKILEQGRNNAGLMNAIAWNILTGEGIVTRDLKLALKAAEAANQASEGENWSVLDTYALALFENGKKADAVRHQRKAIELAKKADAPEQALAELKQRLERFEKGGE
jgi:thiol-disulfide isomerase/thioredoxin